MAHRSPWGDFQQFGYLVVAQSGHRAQQQATARGAGKVLQGRDHLIVEILLVGQDSSHRVDRTRVVTTVI